MSFESAVTFFIAMFVFGITPGPGVFAILARGMVHGWKKCITLSLGLLSASAQNMYDTFHVSFHVSSKVLISVCFCSFLLFGLKRLIATVPVERWFLSNTIQYNSVTIAGMHLH